MAAVKWWLSIKRNSSKTPVRCLASSVNAMRMSWGTITASRSTCFAGKAGLACANRADICCGVERAPGGAILHHLARLAEWNKPDARPRRPRARQTTRLRSEQGLNRQPARLAHRAGQIDPGGFSEDRLRQHVLGREELIERADRRRWPARLSPSSSSPRSPFPQTSLRPRSSRPQRARGPSPARGRGVASSLVLSFLRPSSYTDI